MTDKTYFLQDAARFIGLNANTLQARAKRGIVRGVKPGKRWVFLESDLIAYLRFLQWPSEDRPAPRSGILTSTRLQAELDARLGPPIAARRRSTTTRSRQASGAPSASVIIPS